MNLENLTPAMKQYVQMKQQNPDCILFFRIGDFYEVFFEDAKICASILDLIITSKNKNSENPIPMAWIPYHSVEKYIPRLVTKGYKVAIAEQTTDPIPWKIVERSIKSIITPWTTITEQQKQASYLLAITTTRRIHDQKFWWTGESAEIYPSASSDRDYYWHGHEDQGRADHADSAIFAVPDFRLCGAGGSCTFHHFAL